MAFSGGLVQGKEYMDPCIVLQEMPCTLNNNFKQI